MSVFRILFCVGDRKISKTWTSYTDSDLVDQGTMKKTFISMSRADSGLGDLQLIHQDIILSQFDPEFERVVEINGCSKIAHNSTIFVDIFDSHGSLLPVYHGQLKKEKEQLERATATNSRQKVENEMKEENMKLAEEMRKTLEEIRKLAEEQLKVVELLKNISVSLQKIVERR